MGTEKNYVDIVFPDESADGYYMGKKKKLVDNFIYIDPDWYEQIFDPSKFYILGPKGCGKTLYAAYMCASIRKNTVSRSHAIDVSDYGKLIAMKKKNHLYFTDYLTVWKVILLQKLLFGLDADEISFFGRAKNFKRIQETISKHFGYDVSDDSFNPITVIDSCNKQTEVTDYLNSQLELGPVSSERSPSFSLQSRIQQQETRSSGKVVETVASSYTDTWLRSISAFKNVLEKISFKYDHYLFVDGLDVRPTNISEKEYSECIGALVRAVYELNTKIFGNMDRKDGHTFKIIALTRTDIFLNSNLVNVTSCINDNSVELDWTYSNEKDFFTSKLYKMMNRVLGWDGKSPFMPVDRYFNFSLLYQGKRSINAAMYIQRQSRLRPRDVVVLLRLIQKECKSKNKLNPSADDFDSPELVSHYSNYYTDQVKSEMMFSYSLPVIKSIFEMTRTLRSYKFSENDFRAAYERYGDTHSGFFNEFPSHRQLIDVLYSLDMVGWIERVGNSSKMHWHYREVKAIDELYRLPWEQFDCATGSKLLIHRGASKHILGVVTK